MLFFSERLYTFVHLYEAVLWFVHTREIFIERNGKYNIYDKTTKLIFISCRMGIVKQCSIVMLISVFGCHTNAFIIKCT